MHVFVEVCWWKLYLFLSRVSVSIKVPFELQLPLELTHVSQANIRKYLVLREVNVTTAARESVFVAHVSVILTHAEVDWTARVGKMAYCGTLCLNCKGTFTWHKCNCDILETIFTTASPTVNKYDSVGAVLMGKQLSIPVYLLGSLVRPIHLVKCASNPTRWTRLPPMGQCFVFIWLVICFSYCVVSDAVFFDVCLYCHLNSNWLNSEVV